jgi:hypothetical protein
MTDHRSLAKDPEAQALTDHAKAQAILDEEWGRRNHALGAAYIHVDVPRSNPTSFTLLKRDRFGCSVVEPTPWLLRASFDSLQRNIEKRMAELGATHFTVPVQPRAFDNDSLRDGSEMIWDMRVEFWRENKPVAA